MKTKFLKNKTVQKLFLLIIALVALNFININFNGQKNTTGQATLMLYLDENAKREFVGEVSDNMTMLQVLNSSATGGGFDFRYTLEKLGKVKLYSIDGRNDNSGKRWLFFLNGQPVATGDLNMTPIKTGDLIEAKFR